MKGMLSVFVKLIFTIISCFIIFSMVMAAVGNRNLDDHSSELVTDTVIFSDAVPKVSESQVVAYLEEYAHSSLKGEGSTFYRLGMKYNIDPAFAVAVAQKETSLGKNTCAGISQDCNNFFCVYAVSGQEDCSGFAKYETQADSIEAFYVLIREHYVKENDQYTIAEIGCLPATGRTKHCYCWEGGYCEGWADGSGSVPDFTARVRSYSLDGGKS